MRTGNIVAVFAAVSTLSVTPSLAQRQIPPLLGPPPSQNACPPHLGGAPPSNETTGSGQSLSDRLAASRDLPAGRRRSRHLGTAGRWRPHAGHSAAGHPGRRPEHPAKMTAVVREAWAWMRRRRTE
jgi:hypothetical protein